MNRRDAIEFLLDRPVEFANMIGFDKLTELHNDWIVDMVSGEGDRTLQAHRGSYKTTCLSVAIPIIMLLYPDERILFTRKTDNDIKEVIAQVGKILKTPHFAYFAKTIYGRDVHIVTEKHNELTIDTVRDIRGTSQLVGMGTGGSLTGKHFDRIFTDDIVNIDDRVYRSERERTKTVYQELQNLRNRGGRIFNAGTPWHIDDCFTIMPEPEKFDCYSTGLISEEELAELRKSMAPSLFAANYELEHIAAENALFDTPPEFATDQMAREVLHRPDVKAADLLRDGIAHIDAAYGGEDYTAFTCCQRRGDTLYMYGRMWHGHVDTVLDAVIEDCKRLKCSPIHMESNGDMGFVAREIMTKGYKARTYSEGENKYLKISTYLRKWWENIVWLEGTDRNYLAQIMDYTEDAEHDDAPDSAAVMCRYFDRRKGKATIGDQV